MPRPRRPSTPVLAVLWAVIATGGVLLVTRGVSLIAAALVLYGALAVAAVTIRQRWRGSGARFRRGVARLLPKR